MVKTSIFYVKIWTHPSGSEADLNTSHFLDYCVSRGVFFNICVEVRYFHRIIWYVSDELYLRRRSGKTQKTQNEIRAKFSNFPPPSIGETWQFWFGYLGLRTISLYLEPN